MVKPVTGKRQTKPKRLNQFSYLVAVVVVAIVFAASLIINQSIHSSAGPLPATVTAPVVAQQSPVNHNLLANSSGVIPTIQPVQYPVPNETDLVPVISRIPTTQPVVFLTIDDGVYKEPQAFPLMIANHLQASFFLVYRFINDNPGYFGELSQATGSLIEDHTYDHSLLTNLTYDQQIQEICSDATVLTQWYGRRPVLIRPPGGDYNADTQRAAAACGMKAVIMWDVTIDNGKLNYQVGNHLRPGDIVLMHFRTTFTEDIQAFINAVNKQGLQTELLQNWIT